MMIMNNDLRTRLKLGLDNMEKTEEIIDKLVEGKFISERFGKYLECLSLLDFVLEDITYPFEEGNLDDFTKELSYCFLSLEAIANLYSHNKNIQLNPEGMSEDFIQEMHLYYKKNMPTQYTYLYDIAKEKFDSSINKWRQLYEKYRLK